MRVARRDWWRLLGPGFVTGASDVDPANIGAFAVSGAALGYAQLWVTVLIYPLMTAVQYLCAKLGRVTGRGLAGILRQYYPRWVLYVAMLAVVAANTINAGADLKAMAAGLGLFVPLPPRLLVVPLATVVLAVQLLASYQTIERIFKWLALALLAYVVTAFLAHPPWLRVLLGTFLPVWRMDRLYLTNLVALLGAAISPYLFFWQSSVEVEETRSRRRQRIAPETTEDDLRARAWDVNSGTLFANLIGYFIILASAATLHQHGVTRITDAAQAAQALEPLAGRAARYLFGLGLVGAGFLAVPVFTTSTGYLLAETFSWKSGLNQPVHRAPRFYRTIVFGTAAAALLGLAPVDPLPMLVLAAALNGLLTPPLLALVMVVSSRRDVLGQRVNGPLLNALGWATTLIMAAAAAALVWTWVG